MDDRVDASAFDSAAPVAEPDEEEISFATLARRTQVSALPIPMQNPVCLPFGELDPEVFERLVAEVVHRQDNRGVQFYGRRGQKQYGLDIVERERTDSRSLYQVKRYQEIDGAAIGGAVVEYAGSPRRQDYTGEPRRFDPRRFVLVTSASIDSDKATVDEIARLQDEYAGDLEIEAWGVETLSRGLRDASNLIYAVFGPAWAKAFCGFEPAPPPPGAPHPLALVEEPTEVLGLASIVADAQQLATTQPLDAARLYGSVATELETHSFPGHAALLRRRQADAASRGGDARQAFDVLWALVLDEVLLGIQEHRARSTELDSLVAQLTPVDRAKWEVLQLIAAWYEQGVELADSVSALRQIVAVKDRDAAVLCCLVLEQVVVDALQEHEPPYAVVGEPGPGTRELVIELATLAGHCESQDPILRARLRCAVADVSLTADATLAEVTAAFEKLADDAAAGRYLRAGGLVTSRAAYQFAVHGELERAENLWRRSVLMASEAGFYGDVRNSLRAMQLLHSDSARIPVTGLDIVVRALPNQQRLLAGSSNAVLRAFEAVLGEKFVDAFGSTRRDLWESRIAGHLLEELLALRLFGDVLLGSGHPVEAVQCYVLAGESTKAVKAAKPLTTRAEVDRWLSSPIRRRRAAAIKTLAAQARLIGDDEVLAVVETLLGLAAPMWQEPLMGSAPAQAAVEAVAAMGGRIPAEAIDRLLELSTPARHHATRLSDVLGRLLFNAYWAVPSRRADVAAVLLDMLRLDQPPMNLWENIGRLPASGRGPLLDEVRVLAADGNTEAVEALSGWGDESPVVQLAARRACAALLRRRLGTENAISEVGTQERATVQLLKCLLGAQEEAAVDDSELVPGLSRPAGGTMFVTTVVVESTDEPAAPGQVDADSVDEVAVLAAGPRDALAEAVAGKLLDIVKDSGQGAACRLNTVDALRHLIPDLPASIAAELAPDLLRVHEAPALSELDEWEIGSDVPLSRMRVDVGARDLAPRALVAAAEAFAHGRDGSRPVDDEEAEFAEQLVAYAMSLLQAGGKPAIAGSFAVAAVASAAPSLHHHATVLLFHPDAEVRARGTARAPLGEAMVRQLTADDSPAVRRALAARCAELGDEVRSILAADPDSVVRQTLASCVQKHG